MRLSRTMRAELMRARHQGARVVRLSHTMSAELMMSSTPRSASRALEPHHESRADDEHDTRSASRA